MPDVLGVPVRLSEDVYQAWRAAIVFRLDGRPRIGVDAMLTAVRTLYLDLQGWAARAPAT